jgi:hypothetical protein
MNKNPDMRMESKGLRWVIGGLGLLFLLASLLITFVEYQRFQSQESIFPQGSQIAGVPVGGLNSQTAAVRIENYYRLPLVLEVQGGTVHAKPEELGFSMDAASLVEESLLEVQGNRFWSHLWNRSAAMPVNVPLAASIDDAQIRAYFNQQILPRYIQHGKPITPIPLTTNFEPGQPGQALDSQKALEDIRQALFSPDVHQVTLEISEDVLPLPPEGILEAFLKHNINWIGFDALSEVYLASMGSDLESHFAVQGGDDVQPDVAFTAASTIKIPIMISVLRRTADPTPEGVRSLLERMIVYSENPPADTLMSTYIDAVRGPLMVSEDMAALGLENTFLAGYFYLGAPLLDRFETPANTRTDIYLDPDIYSQTVASEIGQLLKGVYDCAQDGDGLLVETFPEEITQSECQLMIDILSGNRIGLLIEAGLPPDAIAAHKHGWAQELDGLLHSMSDAAIIFTPGEDVVLNVFIYDPDRLDFDQGNRLIARLSQTVYNFFNLENQAYWWFD